MVGFIRKSALAVVESIEGAGRFTRFSWAAMTGLLVERPKRRVLVPLLMEIGIHSVPVVLATGAFVGMVLAVQIYAQLFKLGAETSSGPIINIAIVSELGPVLAAVVLAGRVGGAMSAELGTMKVTEQLDALKTLGADPINYLVTPRFLACLFLVPLLTMYADAIGVVGGYVMCTKFFGISEYYYWLQTQQFIQRWDVFVGIIKAVFFGGAIGLICCYKGFAAGQGAKGVGRATTEAFVAAFVAILVSNFFMSLFFNTLYDHLYL